MSKPIISDEAWHRAALKQITVVDETIDDDLDFRIFNFEWDHYDPSDSSSGVVVIDREALAAQAELDVKPNTMQEKWRLFLGTQLEHYKKHEAAKEITYDDPIPHCCTYAALEAAIKEQS